MSRTQARKTIAQVSMQSPLVCDGCILAVFMLAVVWHLATASNFVESPGVALVPAIAAFANANGVLKCGV